MVLLQKHLKVEFDMIMNNVHDELPKWNQSLIDVQNQIVLEKNDMLVDGYTINANCHVRLKNVPTDQELTFPNNDQIGLLREMKGTAIRVTDMKLLELKPRLIFQNVALLLLSTLNIH